MMLDGGLPMSLWAEMINTAAYLVNRLPIKQAEKTPEEIWTGKRPNVKHLKVIGSRAMVHVPKQTRRKLDPKATKCVMIGYETTTKAYRLFHTETNSTITSRDVMFIEDERPFKVHSLNAHESQFYYFGNEIEVEDSAPEPVTDDPNGNGFGNISDAIDLTEQELDDESFVREQEESYVHDDESFHGVNDDSHRAADPKRKSKANGNEKP